MDAYAAILSKPKIMTQYDIQKNIAATTDDLMQLTENMYRLSITYGQISMPIFHIKRNMVKNQCQTLRHKLEQCQQQLEQLQTPNDPASLAVSTQLLYQNFLLLSQTEQSLDELKEHASITKQKLLVNHNMEQQILITDLQKRLYQIKHKT